MEDVGCDKRINNRTRLHHQVNIRIMIQEKNREIDNDASGASLFPGLYEECGGYHDDVMSSDSCAEHIIRGSESIGDNTGKYLSCQHKNYHNYLKYNNNIVIRFLEIDKENVSHNRQQKNRIFKEQELFPADRSTGE